METNENQYFTKTIKIFDELESTEDNIINITESSNLLMGSGSRVWETVQIFAINLFQAIILSKFAIKKHMDDMAFSKNTILELGSGTGLLSIILASLGKIKIIILQ